MSVNTRRRRPAQMQLRELRRWSRSGLGRGVAHGVNNTQSGNEGSSYQSFSLAGVREWRKRTVARTNQCCIRPENRLGRQVRENHMRAGAQSRLQPRVGVAPFCRSRGDRLHVDECQQQGASPRHNCPKIGLCGWSPRFAPPGAVWRPNLPFHRIALGRGAAAV